MPESRLMSVGGKEILLIDLTHVSDDASIPSVVAEAIRIARSDVAPGNLLTLLDLTGTRVNKQVIASVKNLSEKNGRYAKATSFVGFTGCWNALLKTMLWMRGKKNHKVFASRSEAITWLQTW